MSAISETYDRTHNILELVDVLPNVSFTTIETKHDYLKIPWHYSVLSSLLPKMKILSILARNY